jgi:hypothetical protein
VKDIHMKSQEQRDAVRLHNQIIAEVEATGFDLDEAVHAEKAAEATTINNGGVDNQVAFLVGEYGAAEVLKMVSRR